MTNALGVLEKMRPFPSPDYVLNKPERIATRRWHDAFVGDSGTGPNHFVDKDVERILSEHKVLSRASILAIKDPNESTQWRRIFIASLMWGYGTQGLRYHNKIFAYIANVLNESSSLGGRLANCSKFLVNHNIAGAYQELEGMKGIGPAFFTKYLYFAGRSLETTDEYPLILDSQIAQSLALITGFADLVSLGSYGLKCDAQSYIRYVSTMHLWAKQLSITGEVLEFVLWDKKSRQKIKGHCFPTESVHKSNEINF